MSGRSDAPREVDPRVHEAVRMLISAGMVIHSRATDGCSFYLRWPGRLGTLRVSDHGNNKAKRHGAVVCCTFGPHVKPTAVSLHTNVAMALGRYMLAAPAENGGGRSSGDAPPKGALDAVAEAMNTAAGGVFAGASIYARAVLNRARMLPAFVRWRLIAWLAKGLEPTRGMVEAWFDAGRQHDLGGTTYRCLRYEARSRATRDLAAMLAAASEAGDGQ